MKNLKLIAIVVALVLVALVVVQNTDEVTTRLLFVEVRMPNAVLVFVTFAIGFVVGALATFRAQRTTTKPKAKA